MSHQDPWNQSQMAGQFGMGGQPPGQGAQPGAQQAMPMEEGGVSTPTLRWVSLSDPQQAVALDTEDYVLDSYFNAQYGVWEVLVLVQPTEGEDEEPEDEDE